MSAAAPDRPRLQRVPFSSISGWDRAGFSAFRPAFHSGAKAMAEGSVPLRPARMPDPSLLATMRAVAELGSEPDDIRQVLERFFTPFRVEHPGFVTGYYEPVVDASWHPSAAFRAPILPRPEGPLDACPERAVIEDRAMRDDSRVLVWLRDWTEVFLVQVQGSARVRLPNGDERRLTYAGRNGLPYTSIGKLLIESGAIAPEAMSLDGLKAWLRAHGQEVGEPARTLMRRNRSYIFFKLEESSPGPEGPVGGAGLPLTAGGSIAVDRSVWPYGLPFWVEVDGAVPGFGSGPLRRLFVAQDTGSAIVGPARADLFLGSGDQAGRDAGSIRHMARFTVFLPNAS